MNSSNKHSMFVTGHHGFLGGHVVDHFSSKFNVKTYEGDLFSLPSSFLAGDEKFFFHFAGASSAPKCDEDPEGAYRANVILVEQLLRQFSSLLSSSKTVFVFFSSAHVYGADSAQPIGEATSYNPKSVYARTKASAEMIVRDLCTFYKIPFVIVRLFNTSHHTQVGSFFMPTIYNQIRQSIERRDEKIVLSTGKLNVVRDFLSLQDFVGAMDCIASHAWEKSDASGVYNLCSGSGKLLSDLAKELAFQMTGRQIETPTDKIESQVVGDSSKFQQVFNWQPKYSTDVKNFIESFLQK